MVKYWKVLIGVLLLVALVKLAYFDVNKTNYYWDETIYLDLAENLGENHVYSSSMDENFRPWVLPFILSFFTSTTLMHLMQILLSFLSVFLIYLLGKEIWNKKTGVVAALLLLINPLYFFWSHKLLTEPITLTLITLSLYSYVKYEKTKNSKFLYLSFIAAGFSAQARYTGISLIGALGAHTIVTKGFLKKEYWIAAVLLMLSFIPMFYLGMVNYGHPLGMPIMNARVTIEPAMPLSSYFKDIFLSFGFFAPILFIIALQGDSIKKIPTVIWYYLILTLVLLVSLSQKYTRFLLILLPAYLVIAATGFTQLGQDLKNRKWVFTLILLLIAFLTLNSNIDTLNSEKNNTEILINAAEFAKGLDCPKLITNSTMHMQYFSQKEVIPYPGSQEELEEMIALNNSCLIVDNFHGVTRYRKFINDTFTEVYVNKTSYRFVNIYTK